MQTYSMYGGEVTLTFDEAKHIYRANGEIVEGATTVLRVISKPALINWAANMSADYVKRNLTVGVALDEVQIIELIDGAKKAHRVKADQSAGIGQLGHAWFEDYFNGKNPPTPINPALRAMTEAFLGFTSMHKVEVLETERRIYSREWKFAGTVDLICKIDGELTVADYKTGNGIYAEMLAQCGAYDIGYSEETEQYPTRHMLINCNAKGELTVALSEQTKANRGAFINALLLSRSMKELDTEMKAVKTTLQWAEQAA